MSNDGYIDQLIQLLTATWDGDLIGKTHRNKLVEKGLADRKRGWNFITAKGIEYLDDLGLLKS